MQSTCIVVFNTPRKRMRWFYSSSRNQVATSTLPPFRPCLPASVRHVGAWGGDCLERILWNAEVVRLTGILLSGTRTVQIFPWIQTLTYVLDITTASTRLVTPWLSFSPNSFVSRQQKRYQTMMKYTSSSLFVALVHGLLFCCHETYSFNIHSKNALPRHLTSLQAAKEDPSGRRRKFLEAMKRVFIGGTGASVWNLGASGAIAADIPTMGRIVDIEVANLNGEAGNIGTIRIQLRPEWAPRGVSRFEVSAKEVLLISFHVPSNPCFLGLPFLGARGQRIL